MVLTHKILIILLIITAVLFFKTVKYVLNSDISNSVKSDILFTPLTIPLVLIKISTGPSQMDIILIGIMIFIVAELAVYLYDYNEVSGRKTLQ